MTPRMRRTRDSMPSSTELSAAIWRPSTWSSEVCRRTSTLSTPWTLANWLDGRAAITGARDSSRASRSGGATKITVSLIGEGLGVAEEVASVAAAPRDGGLIDPVTAASGMAPSAVARDSSVVWRRMIWSSFWSNCS